MNNHSSQSLFFCLVAVVLVSSFPVAFAAGGTQGDKPNAARNTSPHRMNHRAQRHPKVGQTVRVLPKTNRTLRLHRKTYRYHDGTFYRPGRRADFIVVRAPVGARVRHLPPGYVSFYIGPRRYFYLNYTYYRWYEPKREYVVVSEPAGVEEAILTTGQNDLGELFVYPKEGQNEAQRERDRYDCYLWASKQTDFDPGDAAANIDNAGNYRRALSACLEGRGYTVR